jgi:hypothetical protein
MRALAFGLLLSLAAQSAPVPSPPAEPDLIRLQTIFYAGEKTGRVHCIRREQLAALPQWTGEGPPPLAPETAIEIARAAVRASYPDVQGIRLWAIHLQRIPATSPPPDRWYYYVDFVHLEDGQVIHALPLYALVLFDGKLVPATAECANAPGAWYH